jgi:tRNA(Ile)-lysidine synthase
MAPPDMPVRVLEIARASGLVPAGEPLLVMLSGGADSVCLLDVAVRLGARVNALHVNHGLRPEAADDESFCRVLCERMDVPLAIERLELASAHGPGNLQAEARDARYSLAERHAGGGDYAAAHTATDQAETLLYRLAVSPGRRALLGMPARRGRLVRPLLEATREDTRSYCEARGLDWRDDPSNQDSRFARARVRHEVLPALRELNPALERTLGETVRLLRDEHEALERLVDGVMEELGGLNLATGELRRRPPALARLVLRRAADAAAAAAGRPEVAVSRADVDAILGAGPGGTHAFDLGGGLRCVVEYGIARFTYAVGAEAPEPVHLSVPGAVRFGGWEVEARLGRGGEAIVDAGALGDHALVRGWRDGDRMRPAGLGGTKSLQDLFTDNKVPRELRRALPLVEVDGEIAWVAGVALAEGFSAGAGEVVSLTARLAHG